MTGHESTASKPQLADMGEQLQREFAGRVLAMSVSLAAPTLLSDDWWSVFDAIESEMRLLYQPIQDVVMLQSSLTEGFVPSDLFGAHESADEPLPSEESDVSSQASSINL